MDVIGDGDGDGDGSRRRWSLTPVLALLLGCHAAQPTTPRGSYPTGSSDDAGALVVDEAAFDHFADALRADLERAPLPAAIAEQDARFVLAMLDALDDRWADATGELDRVRALVPDERAKLMTGLSIRMWAAAGGENANPDAFAIAADRTIAALPVDRVRPDLEMLHAMAVTFTSPEVCRDLVRGAVHPHDHTVTFADAQMPARRKRIPVDEVWWRVEGSS